MLPIPLLQLESIHGCYPLLGINGSYKSEAKDYAPQKTTPNCRVTHVTLQIKDMKSGMSF